MNVLMKKLLSTFAMAGAILTPSAYAAGQTQANGITVDVEVIDPTPNSNIAVPAFPAEIPLTMSFSAVNPNGDCVLTTVKMATVTATNIDTNATTTIFSGDPGFSNASCPTSKTFTWTVAGPGTYTLTVAASGGNGDDSASINVTIELELMTMEYPAPPAIANLYINSTPELKASAPKKRGCVISKIAEQHAKFETYGPKGGPYNQSKVESDVVTFYPLCK